MWLMDDLNYNSGCEWPIKLYDNKLSKDKLSDNNLASELVDYHFIRSILKCHNLITQTFFYRWVLLGLQLERTRNDM